MIAFLKLTVALGSLLLMGLGLLMLTVNTVPLVESLITIVSGAFLFVVLVSRVGEAE